ncbi:MAG TPA: EAL domain-containing protein [Bacillales bacterium]|nr:EAL domain-containing protein [Bacillales bacterium]
MQTYLYTYEDPDSLRIFFQNNALEGACHLLVKVYVVQTEQPSFEDVSALIKSIVPHARIYLGTEGDHERRQYGKKPMLFITAFEETSVQDLTLELSTLQLHLQESEQRYRSLFEHHPNLIYSMDRQGVIQSVNPALIKETGYLPKEIRNTPAVNYVADDQKESVIQRFRKTLKGESQHFSIYFKNKFGSYELFEVTNVPIFVNGAVVGVYGIAQNMTKQKEAQDKIIRLAYHDSLTGLPNRTLLQKTLESEMKLADGTNSKLAVLFVDFDRFKLINDSVGHHDGDEVLKRAVKRMKTAIGREHILSRFNGDEFVVLLRKVEDTKQITDTLRTLTDAFERPVEYGQREFYLSISIGVSLYPDDTKDAKDLLKHADTALAHAKQKGQACVSFYKEEMQHYFTNRLQLENDLRKALEKNEFTLFYQPLMCVTKEKITGCEALIRWNHPTFGQVPPNVFIPLAEETGLIDEIGSWVMETACKQTKKWHDDGYNDFAVSVNVSARQFERSGFPADVQAVLAKTGLPAHCLHLELTESTTLRDIRSSVQHLQALKKLGVKVSIDDFGTGYASLSYLKEFSVDILKIDQSFVRSLNDKTQDRAIVKAILTMCEGLSVTAVAEGVETEDQLNVLKQFGCRCVQGYFYSRPLPVKKFESFLTA